jgi:Type I phosphodiesterase / nucleotide pyrophosphatase
LKANAIVSEISGKKHDGVTSAPVPTLFGMNFQAVSVGEKLVENGVTGGYTDALGTPSKSLLKEIEFVDKQIGRMINALKENGLYESTLVVITAKHGQSPIDPKRVLRIPADNANMESPATLLGDQVAGSSEDDISLIWLKNQNSTSEAVETLSTNADKIGAGEIFAGRSMSLRSTTPSQIQELQTSLFNPM